MSERDWRDLFEQAAGLPYGTAKTLVMEEALRAATVAGADEFDLFHLRMRLTSAYQHGGEPAKAFTTFSRCLSAFDADPARYGTGAQEQLLWHFKWIVNSLTEFPEIPLERTYAVLDDMERRYREGGHSLQAVHHYRNVVARHIGDAVTAAEQFELWRTTPRDGNSDCEGCDPSSMASHLILAGADEAAIELARPVLDGHLTCTEQPQDILRTLMLPYLRTGRPQEAVDAHRRGYRVHRRNPAHYLAAIGDHLYFCALTGNEARGLEILERHLGTYDTPPTPHDAMMFAASAALLLDRLAATGHGHLTVGRPAHGDRPAGDVTAHELRDLLRADALEIAARFDERNRTTAQGDRVRARLEAEPLFDHLPLSEHAPRPARSRTSMSPADTPRPRVDTSGDGAELLERAVGLWRVGRCQAARTVLERFDALAREAQPSAEALARRTELEGGLRGWAGDLPGAAEAFRAAAEAFAAVGLDIERHRTLGRLGALLLEQGEEAGREYLEAALEHQDLHADVDERVMTRVRYAQVLLGEDPQRALELIEEAADLGPEEPTTVLAVRRAHAHAMVRADAAVEEFAAELAVVRETARAVGAPLALAEASLWHAQALQALASQGGDDKPVDAAFAEAVAQDPDEVPDGLRATALFLQGRWLHGTERSAEAIAPLAEAVALFTASGQAEPAAHARFPLAAAYLAGERHLEAAEVAEEALAVEEEAGFDKGERMALREILARSLTAIGEVEDALTRWEELIGLEGAEQTTPALAMLTDETALLLSGLDRDAEAAARFDAAARMWEELGEPFQAADRHQRAAMSHHWAGEHQEARSASQRAEEWLDRAVADSGLDIPEEQAHWTRASIRFDRARLLWNEQPGDAEREAEAAIGLFRAAGDEEAASTAERLLTAIRESGE
ncbi:hypothetical protein ACQEU5_18425 [Marinactinospora thermotolerans]|uniref:Tetratricopeptide repeat-containing protein n=1 Tax=Marinactinospora thermotolerans DSM 45154 TaxID=1122192 RepID=A0A1T4T6G8_9ACTN|nr:hypothetical protein [Marinactinospora thermotolerans]SKA36056.1 hypothetical protein SAMN02745673_04568 [Marinactinospora thermotolerans DSM 45154]